MSGARSALLAVAGAVAGACALLALSHPPAPVAGGAPEASASDPRIEQLELQIRQLTAVVAHVRGAERAPALPDDAKAAPPPTGAPATGEERHQARIATLDGQLARDEVDRDAPAFASTLGQAFVKVSGVAIEASTCTRSLCRVSLHFDSREAQEALFAELEANPLFKRDMDLDHGDHATTLYLARDGHRTSLVGG